LQVTSKKNNGKSRAKAKAASGKDDELKPLEYWTEVLQGTPDVLSREGTASLTVNNQQLVELLRGLMRECII
jgi:hypothetical protein